MIFQHQVPDITQGKMISVTVVRTAPDLGFAKVYLSIFPKGGEKEILKTCNEQVGQIRHLLAQKVRKQLRKLPELHFYQDDSLDYAERIEELLT